ncbi:rRNA maturation RNase YbeY [Candidatus Deianiraea vastatrix]|uniref:Endoribonuclease YbeY n=1 Tax=Candidatus Deianiraea vastatrix TaxID=2163644 RepID=A0A5B8XDW8_9RICK|nr:rRNA maturation RNase YbeY [Candidatus Deianiraea vastatrix]QED23502.1 16S rRNA maturation RNase YbeY [Candidatus Deianiraea vastatrix]
MKKPSIQVNVYKKSRNLKIFFDVDKTFISKIVNHVAIFLHNNISYEMTLLLSNDIFIQNYNRDYRNKDTPTNVLSFESSDKDEDFYLGDMIISLETIAKEANEQGKSIHDHFTHILIHGVLHLFGMDHILEDERIKMEKLEIEILKTLGISDPYLDF